MRTDNANTEFDRLVETWMRPHVQPLIPGHLSRTETANRLAISTETLRQLRKKDESFPKPIKIGSQMLFWRAADIEKWIISR